MAPMQDDTLYNMTDNTEYQANLFAADLLIDDDEIEEMVQNENLSLIHISEPTRLISVSRMPSSA